MTALVLATAAAEAQSPRTTVGGGMSVVVGALETHPVAGSAWRLVLRQPDQPEWHFEAGVLLLRERDDIVCIQHPCPPGRWRAASVVTLRTAFVWPLAPRRDWYVSSGIGGYLAHDVLGTSPRDAVGVDVALGRRNLGWWTGSYVEARFGFLHSWTHSGATLQIHAGVAQ